MNMDLGPSEKIMDAPTGAITSITSITEGAFGDNGESYVLIDGHRFDTRSIEIAPRKHDYTCICITVPIPKDEFRDAVGWCNDTIIPRLHTGKLIEISMVAPIFKGKCAGSLESYNINSGIYGADINIEFTVL